MQRSMRPEEILQHLNASTGTEKLRAVRYMKNSIIGNKTKKDLFVTMGVVPKLVQFLQDSDTQLAIQAAVSLGSFAYGNDQIINQLVHCGAISPLLALLAQDKDPRLQESAARSLKALLQINNVAKDEIFRDKHVTSLMKLLMQADSKQGPSPLAELSAAIIARCCETSDQQQKIVHAGAIRWLMQMLAGTNPKAQESAADALASLCRDNPEIGRQIIAQSTNSPNLPAIDGSMVTAELASASSTDIVSHLLRLVHDKRPTMRLLASTCLVNLYRCQAIPQERSQEILVTLLPCLVKLFADSSMQIKEKAPLILAYLVSESEDMQKSAADADAIPKLSQLLQWADEQQSCMSLGSAGARGLTDRLIESSLLALAAVCSLKEECRKLVIDAKVLPIVIKALEHKNVAVRAAACQCTRSLSRSVKNLRTSLVDGGIAAPLFKLLSDESVSVKTTASATLCNIVLDFSPMKKTVIESGGVEKLAALVSSMDSNLRLNAVWALKNLLFQAESEIKAKVMQQLTYPTLNSLMHDSEIGIQEQSLNLLRNLACGNEADIQAVFEGMQEESLMQLLDEKLRMSQEEIILQTLYVIVNISTGNERHKAAIIKHPTLLQHILHYMGHSPCAVRVATIWCLINLTWPEDKGSEERVLKLKQMGFEEKLKTMEDDADLDVKDRVKTALQHFQTATSGVPARQSISVDVQMADN